jgi:hypothetical protein
MKKIIENYKLKINFLKNLPTKMKSTYTKFNLKETNSNKNL